MSGSIQGLAGEAYGWFEVARRATGDTATGPREDGEEFVRVKDGAPQWVTDLVYAAHGEMLPDDWKYARIMSALECIGEADDAEDAAHEWADAECDVYTSALTAWLGSSASRPGYCDEAAEEMGITDMGITERIAVGQYQEAREVYASVLSSLENESEVRS